MSQNPTMYGRKYELTWMNAKLFPKKNTFSVPPLVLLHGPKGRGKTLLAREVVQLHREGSGNLRLIVFSVNAENAGGGLPEFSQALMQSGETVFSNLQSDLSKLKSEFNARVSERARERLAAAEAYNDDGTVKTVAVTEGALAEDPKGIELAAIGVELIQELYDQVIQRDEEGVSELRFLYIFDDFSDFAPTIKRWIGGPLMEEFSDVDGLPAPSFLLTDQDSWETGGQKDYWQKNPGTYFDMEIPPMDQESCLEWLTDAGHSPSFIDLVMEDSEGMPERVQKLIETPGLIEEKAEESAGSEEDPVQKVSARERRWLHAAAIADYVPEDSLLLLLGAKEGRDALRWLGSRAQIDGISFVVMGGENHIHLRPEFREEILAQNASKVPARHREFLDKFELHTQVTEKVPETSDRDSLRVLAPIQPFNTKILRELFGDHE